eukprot:4989985-Amphidinium_carterae.2
MRMLTGSESGNQQSNKNQKIKHRSVLASIIATCLCDIGSPPKTTLLHKARILGPISEEFGKATFNPS